MNNHKEKYYYKKKKAEKQSSNNATEDVIYNELFIVRKSNQEHDSEIFIMDSGATSHMVYLEENMTNLNDYKTQVTIGYSRNHDGTKHDNWNGYQRRDRKLHRVTLSNMYIIPGLYSNVFIVTRAPQKGFQVTQEGKTLILEKIQPIFILTRKW